MSGRLAYLVCYDICEPKRLRNVYKTMRGFGEHLQYSVFRCELTDAEKVRMITALGKILNDQEDHPGATPGRKTKARPSRTGHRMGR